MPSHQWEQHILLDPVDTYATVLPVIDCRKPATVTKGTFPVYYQSKFLIQDRQHHIMVIAEM